MTSNGWHPSGEELAAFDAGLLPRLRWAVVADHVAACDACCEQLETVPQDPLVDLLRKSGSAPAEPRIQ
jgi:hypothetical protein